MNVVLKCNLFQDRKRYVLPWLISSGIGIVLISVIFLVAACAVHPIFLIGFMLIGANITFYFPLYILYSSRVLVLFLDVRLRLLYIAIGIITPKCDEPYRGLRKVL